MGAHTAYHSPISVALEHVVDGLGKLKQLGPGTEWENVADSSPIPVALML